jgi:lysyl endopeptidase
MIRFPLAWAPLLAGFLLGVAHAAPEMPSREAPWRDTPAVSFKVPGLPALQAFTLAAPSAKAAAPEEHPGGRLRIGTVRGLPKAGPVEQWTRTHDGLVARFDAASEGAEGLRVKLDVSAIDRPLEVRVSGADGRIEMMTVQPGRKDAWTPWTEGALQAIEIFSRTAQPVSVGAIAHFTGSPLAKATAGTCTVPTMCSTNDATLDAAIVERKKSLVKISFMESGGAFLCSATLVNTERFPAPYMLTANHCVSTAEAAASVESYWFYELSACDPLRAVVTTPTRLSDGMQLVFTNANIDSSLLLMAQSPPAGATYSGWNAARVGPGSAVTSLSHPHGDTARLAIGACDSCGSDQNEFNIAGRPQRMYGVRFTRGIIENGSSGSGLFTLSGGSLQLRGILSGTTIRNGGGMSCTNLDEDALYGRMDILHPQIDPFIRASGPASDDAPNRLQDMAADAGADTPLNLRTGPVEHNARRIDYAGDLDLYRFVLTAPAVVSAWTEGANLDTVGSILDSRGSNIDANDDEQSADNHFGLTRHLEAGTYYVQVGHFEPAGTGTYNLRIRADSAEAENHTALWWNAAENGWGLNVNHQGNLVFATLFTYDASGPLWLVMSRGERQADGSYLGELYRMRGPAFNAMPFGAATPTAVGTMRLAFTGANALALAYSVDGVQVSKSLTRQAFGTVATCNWSAFDRSYTLNLQDLWNNPAEPGWGVNLTQQDDILFATLFTYGADGRPLWLVMSRGDRTSSGFSGPLYRMSGPPFNSSPWAPATPTQVGTMTVAATHGNAATLTYTFGGVTVTKQIQRQVFATVKPACE